MNLDELTKIVFENSKTIAMLGANVSNLMKLAYGLGMLVLAQVVLVFVKSKKIKS